MVQITTSDLTGEYWTGRCTLSGWTEERGYLTFTLSIDADPYRYDAEETEVTASAAADPGTAVTITNSRKWVSPTVTVTGGSVSLVIGNTTYELQEGSQTIPGLVLRDGEATVNLVGNPAVSVTFTWRKGRL